MATKKVKKFGRGGDILTALGAGLAGYGAYKYFTKDDQGKDTSTGLKAGIDAGKKANQEREDAKEVKKPEAVAEDKGETKTDSGRNSNLSPVEQHAAITKRSDSSPPVRVLKKKDNKKDNKSTTTTNNVSPFKGDGMAGSDRGDKSKPYPLNTISNEFLQSKPYPEAEAKTRKEAEHTKYLQTQAGLGGKGITTPGNAKAGDKRGSTQKGRSENPIQGTIDNATRSTVRSDKEKMGERAREVQRRREEEAKSRYKKGGSVKASKMGSVKTAKPTMRSASSRADGIAIRGKTRA